MPRTTSGTLSNGWPTFTSFVFPLQLDWGQVKENAARYELDAIVGPTLAACSQLFGTPVPENFASRRSPPMSASSRTRLMPSESWKQTLFYPRLLKRRSDKLRWLAQTFFVPKLADHKFVRLPASLTFLYYVLRPLRLTCKWSWRFCAGFRADGRKEVGRSAIGSRYYESGAGESASEVPGELATPGCKHPASCLNRSGKSFTSWSEISLREISPSISDKMRR